ncbi:MAG: DUF4405 domain-containing protein, partial [Acidobacteriota bacterium]|nr:DUF4405 domain-containing protein [Acidobacteriota bacterium]
SIGLVVAAMILLHLLLSWTWIASSTKRLFSGAPARTRVNYILNLSLFGVMVATIFSGILISQHAVPSLASADIRWGRLHDRFSNIVVVLSGLHLAINWDWLLAATRKLASR